MKDIREVDKGAVEVPSEVPFKAICEIHDVLRSEGINISLPDDLFVWKTEKGSFAKRLAKYIKRHEGIKLSSDIMGKIGDIAGRYCTTPETMRYDIVSEIDWHAGDFGDYGSCFWSERGRSRRVLQQNGIMAIRFFTEFGGYARALVATTDYGYVVFNGYGLHTAVIADILREIVEANLVQDVELVPSSHFDLYINNSKGYLVTDEEHDLYRVVLDLSRTKCDECGEDGKGTIVDHAGYLLCRECEGEFDRCEACGYVIVNDFEAITTVNEQIVCEACFNTYTAPCDLCGADRSEYDLISTSSGYRYCLRCAQRTLDDDLLPSVRECEYCNRLISPEEAIVGRERRLYCHGCVNKHIESKCVSCRRTLSVLLMNRIVTDGGVIYRCIECEEQEDESHEENL